MLTNSEWQKAQRGKLYHAFVPELIAARDRTKEACNRFNTANLTCRHQVELWRAITHDPRPLPPVQSTPGADDQILSKEPWIGAPIQADYGFDIIIGEGSQLNFNSTFVDTCPIRIGARTLVGPNCSFYFGTHPLDPAVQNGTEGPELGKPITIGNDCWLGGNVIVLPGVTIGKACTIGAGSAVTKTFPHLTLLLEIRPESCGILRPQWIHCPMLRRPREQEVTQGANTLMRSAAKE